MNDIAKSVGFIIFIAFLHLGSQDLSAQLPSYSMEDVKGRFENQVTNIYQEKIFVHTDRTSYITGETVWLNAYCVDAAVHVPVDLSKVVNIELLDISGHAVKQIRVRLRDGLGSGQIFITPDISSGSYLLRAYTNWMKNFDPALVFQQKIEIVNPASVKDSDSIDLSNSQPVVEFFPEGGNLVSGLKSKVAIKASDKYGNGLSVTGVVYDNQDIEVADFTTSELGYTYFFLTPDSTKTYFAMIELDSLIKKYPMPEVMPTGVSLSASTSENGNLTISIHQTEDFINNAYLVIHTRGIIKKILAVDLMQDRNININASELSEGISHITLLSSDFTALSERLVFKYPDLYEPIDLNINNDGYKRREKVDLLLELNEKWSKGDSANLSVAVSQVAGPGQYTDNIISSLLLTSDLKGQIADPWVYFDPNNRSGAKQLDLVMLTNGWRRFDWDTVKGGYDIQLKYPAEINAPIISGQVSKNGQERLPISLQMNFLGKASVMNSVDLSSEGFFHIEVPFRITNERVYFFVNRDTLLSNQLSIISPFDLKPTNTRYFKDKFAPESKDYLEKLNTNIQIAQVYRDYTRINGSPVEVLSTSTPFYGTPDHLYRLDDYTRFETIGDLFLEYIRTAVIRDNNRMSGFYVVNDGYLPGSALTLIDGVPIFDTDYVLNFDPLKIESISVIKSVYSMGSASYQGIIDFTTYQGDFDEQELPEYIVEKVYYGLQQPRVFYAPDYSSSKDQLERIPDFRSTLYWNPRVKIDGAENIQLEFFTSDDTGLYQVEINGITNQGHPIFLQSSFEVRE